MTEKKSSEGEARKGGEGMNENLYLLIGANIENWIDEFAIRQTNKKGGLQYIRARLKRIVAYCEKMRQDVWDNQAHFFWGEDE